MGKRQIETLLATALVALPSLLLSGCTLKEEPVGGPKGDPGVDGDQGPQGDNGPMGPAGPQGAEGPQGPAGPQGGMGPVGPAGPQGGDGPAGPAGPAGASPFSLNNNDAYYTAGRVGIGTSTPTHPLTVVGDLVAANHFTFAPVFVAQGTPTKIALLGKRDALVLIASRLQSNGNGFCSYIVHVAAGNANYGGSPSTGQLSQACDSTGVNTPSCTFGVSHADDVNFPTITATCARNVNIVVSGVGVNNP